MKLTRKRNLIVLFVAAIGTLLLPPVLADDKAQAGASKAVHRKKGPPVDSRNSGGKELKEAEKPPDMPGITYPNAKFLYGFTTETKIGRNLGARFEVPESGPSVISYYRSALKQGGWQVNEEGARQNQVVASNTQYKSTVTITTFQSAKPGCQVYFSYGIRN